MGVLQMRRKRSYTEEFRRLAVARMQGCHNISALAKELEVPRRLLYRWQMRLQGPVVPIATRSSGLRDMYLTPLTPTCSVRGHGRGFSEDIA
jgi:hypothetical protein